jgi:hypothetical protein
LAVLDGERIEGHDPEIGDGNGDGDGDGQGPTRTRPG